MKTSQNTPNKTSKARIFCAFAGVVALSILCWVLYNFTQPAAMPNEPAPASASKQPSASGQALTAEEAGADDQAAQAAQAGQAGQPEGETTMGPPLDSQKEADSAASAQAQPQKEPKGPQQHAAGSRDASPQKPASEIETVGDVLDDPGIDWKNPDERAQAIARMKAAEEGELERAIAIAQQRGLPIREELSGGGVRELTGIDEQGELLYVETKNANAAISTGANLLLPLPYSLDGAGITVGVWDGDSALVTHQEFNEGAQSRVRNVNNEPTSDHATHVTGTIAAYGIVANARGMAPQVLVDSYDWTNDDAEMAAAGAFAEGQFDTKVYLSNHSYGFSYGWRWSSTNSRHEFFGTGSDQNAYDSKFGRYSQVSDNMDTIVYNAPYYTIFWAAGNENTDGPNNGNTVYIQALGTTVTYDSSIHPPKDGDYRNGFETVADESASKNLIVIGAARDAVTNGLRDSSKATKVSFSSTGPTDDGRIKPDLMANGDGLYSTRDTGDTAYGSKSGTSMASPNATGSAALLVELYRELFGSNAAMRASTLKGLLIHTATDVGNPGPDYQTGWGLVDVKTAADHIQREADFPGLNSIIEDQVTPAQPTKTYNFFWDGASPIRATLCWTDPPGTSDGSTHDERTPDLVNNLNIKLTAPDGTTEYFPFVMPFVGTWTEASMNSHATTGVNNTDNVEQILVQSPGQVGDWQAEVTYTGSLTDNVQAYGLLISGIEGPGQLGFSSESYSIDENAGTATISVNRQGGGTGAVTVDYATSNGTALAGSDYTAASGTLSWAHGEQGTKTFNVPITNDSTSETYEETLSITLSNPTGGITIGGTNPVTLTIVDDEASMGLTAPNGGETLPVSTVYNITWTSILGGDVKIELFKNGILYQTLATSTPNDGLYEWNIPPSIPNGSDYRIAVTSLGGGAESDESNALFTVENLVDVDIYTADMSSDPGWTLEGSWAYGQPTGSGEDPSSGHTGNNVIGYNLSGDYENAMSETHATTPVIDCSELTNVQLSFYRDLAVEASSYDKAAVAVSTNGTDWTPVWTHDGATFDDATWTLQTYDISNLADGQSTVYVRWTMGTTDSSVTFGGWNIDDVVVSGTGDGFVNPAGELVFNSDTFTVDEDAGSATITIDRLNGSVGAVSVDYSTSNGTATAGSDYTATSGTLNWADGDATSKTFTVPISNDSAHEDFIETVTLTLSNTVGATIGDLNPATLNIRDNDNNPPSVNAGTDQAVEWVEVAPIPGLYYGTVPGNIDITTPNPQTQILVDVGSETENAIAGNTTEIYTGNIYDADGQISFTENIDDKASIWIDGVLVLSDDVWSARTSTANLNLTPGWHTIEIRISNGSGGSGPAAGIGIGYDPAGGTNWQTLVDPGDGSFLKANQTTSRGEANLNGTVSDLDGDLFNTTWSLVSGPGSVTFGDASSIDTTAQFDAWGVYTLRLTADDGRGPVSDDVIITVNAPDIQRTVTYDGNGNTGGSVPVDPNSPYQMDDTVTVLGNTGSLVRDGYTFSNWNTAANGSGTTYAAADTFTITNDVTLYAQWAPVTYTVSYNGNGNTGGSAPADQTKSHDVGLTLAEAGTLVKTGYSFAGWNTSSDGLGVSYAAGDTYSVNAGVTLYAQWNSAPTVNAGADQTVYLGGSAPWSPSSITTLAWYDAADATTITASGGTVSQWNDKSSNGRTIAQTTTASQPAYASNTVSFDGTDDYLWNDAPFMYANGQVDVFVVGGVAPTTDDRLLSEGSSTTNNTLYCIAQTDNSDASVMSVYIRDNTGGVLSAQPALSATGAFNDTRKLYQWRDTGSQISGRVNGVTGISAAYTRSGTFTLNRFSMGAILRASDVTHLNADVNEIIICNNLSDADRQKMEGYLAHKWGLTGSLPSGHPYKAAAPGSPAAVAALNGTITDSDGGPLTQQWTKQAGPAADVAFDDASAVDTNANFTELGTYTLRLTADDGFGQAYDEVNITVELPPLSVAIADAEISENGGTTTATITRIGTSGDLQVSLSSDDTGEATVPATTTILDGTSSVDATITGIPDGVFDGIQTVTITATAENNSAGSATVNVINTDPATYTVTYVGNGSDGGTVPVDSSSPYDSGSSVIVLDNSGTLVRSGYGFNGWNTAADGTGTAYAAGDSFTITEDVTLYAQWSETYTGWTSEFSGTLTDPGAGVDFDNGGVPTGLEWVYGGDPTSSNDDATITPIIDDSDPQGLTFTFRRSAKAAADPNTSISVLYGSDLTGWTPAEENGTTIVTTVTPDGFGTGIDRVEVRIDLGLFTGDQAFVRLQVDVTP